MKTDLQMGLAKSQYQMHRENQFRDEVNGETEKNLNGFPLVYHQMKMLRKKINGDNF